MKKTRVAVLVLCVCAIAGVSASPAGAVDAPDGAPIPDGNAVLHWNDVTADATVTSGISPLFDPLHESRMYAMVHVAIHDALNAIERHSEPYAFDMGTWPDASPEAAVAAAAHGVLQATITDLPIEFAAGIGPALEQVETAYAEALAAIPDGRAKRIGTAVGNAAAATVVLLRADDGADTPFIDPDYLMRKYGTDEPPAGIFRYVKDAPFNVATGWGEVTPWVMYDGSQFLPDPPNPITSDEYAADFNEMKALGGIDSTARTAEQTEIALFWFEASPMRWNRIARTVASEADLDLWDAARLFGLLDLALADGYIGNWDAKEHYDAWRPETAIHLAAIDGNPDTEPDMGWMPMWGSSGATPEHDSGHAIEGAAAATVLKRFFGTDDVTFEVCSYTMAAGGLPSERNCDGATPTLRTFHSFSDAALENAETRILVGWHFRTAVEDGLEHGRRIADRAVDRYLRPVPGAS